MEHETDAALRARGLAGDENAFDELLRRAEARGEETARQRHETVLQAARWVIAVRELMADTHVQTTCGAAARLCGCAM